MTTDVINGVPRELHLRAINMLQDHIAGLARQEFPDNDQGDLWQRKNEIERRRVERAVAELRALLATAQPAADGEREAFERYARREWPSAPLRYVRDALPKDDPLYGTYCSDFLHGAWTGWQARAAQPQQAVAVTDEVPAQCRQRLAAEGKPYPRSSCPVCGQLSPKWHECDAALAAHKTGEEENAN